MFDGLFMLVVFCIVMASASLLAGALPLSFTLSQSQIRLISTVGMGVLVGTSLIVIIPEGIETLYSARSSSPGHAHVKRRDVHANVDGARWLPHERVGSRSLLARSKDDHEGEEVSAFDLRAMPGPVVPDDDMALEAAALDAPITKQTVHVPRDDLSGSNPAMHPGTEDMIPEAGSPHAYVGLALVLGFILMYLIDKIPQHASSASHVRRQPYHISLDNLGQDLTGSGVNGVEADGISEHGPPLMAARSSSSSSSSSASTTIGLVIHAAADGIALGASSLSSSPSSSATANTNLGLMVFLAIMVHKAPAAFGLTSVLLKQGLGKRRARAHLVVFSLAAPLGALATWFLVHMAGAGRMGARDEELTRWWTGILLLFSGGTFLYVAMHTMQEDHTSSSFSSSSSSSAFSSSIPNDQHFSNGYLSGSNGGISDVRAAHDGDGHGPRWRDTLAAVAGMLIPLLTQLGHHSH